MNKFQFKLKGLHRLRVFKEEACKIELGEINKEIYRLKSRVEACQEAISIAYDSQNKQAQQQISARNIQFFPQYITGQMGEIDLLEKKIAELEKQRDDKIIELNKRRGEVRVLEKLKEKELKKFKKEYDKKMNEDLEEEVSKWLFRKTP